ncbi:hypothetical protein [Streptodolium elevatio]|uniref:Uncharacterized protein n=1 Tax=Streptodolium elevatio TaxID=3157996 RepID=A0ABV3DKR5_9ACTN
MQDGVPDRAWAAGEPVSVAKWVVLVKEHLASGGRMEITQVYPADNQESARRMADHLVWTYQPRHPWTPGGRRVFRRGVDAWIVDVQGQVQRMHFEVLVAEQLAGPGQFGQ